MYIEIKKEDEVKKEEIGQGDRTHYYQTAIAYLDTERFPSELRIKLTKNQLVYPVGFYRFDDSCFSINRFKFLEFNPYNFKLIKIDKPDSLSKTSH